MAISAADVKKLREMTGAGPLECKKALEETNGDFKDAEKRLKEKGLAAVEKRSDRAANEGKIFVKARANTAALAEVTTETDFVARNPDFAALGEAITDTVLAKGYTDIQPDLTALVADLAAKIGENMNLKRIKLVKAEAGEYLAHYIHGDGAIGVVVKLGADKPETLEKDDLRDFAHNIALHIAAFSPSALDKTRLDPAFITEQTELFRKQMEQDESLRGKTPQVLEGILKGRMKKHLAEICLMDQSYVKDDSLTVSQALADCGKRLGDAVTVRDYVYFKVGQ
ncbi:MAG: translation elongation factor Ts [Spirochaetaceae bacterium]|jgi:elongation factor Ts|nr:translation elongation factor Ts [Spirochaetaceae bacterium]